MFAGLFGAKKPEAPKVDAKAAMASVDKAIEDIELRSKKVEHEKDTLMAEAKRLGKTGKPADRNRALQTIKRAKMRENEFNKLQGQLYMLEQQKQLVDTSNFDANVYSAIKTGTQVIDQNRQKLSVDEIQDIQEKMAEQQADADEIADVMAQAALEGNAEAEDMLDELLAEDAMEEMDAVPIPGMGQIDSKVQPVPAKPQPAQA